MQTYFDTIYKSVLGMGVVSALILLVLLKRRSRNLPKEWKQSVATRKFQWSILFLAIYLLVIFIGEEIAMDLARKGIYNHFIIAINYTFHLPFFFAFLFINTQAAWKRYIYIVLYFILVGHFIWNGHYNPNSVMSIYTDCIIDITVFMGTLIHLTDLLIHHKSDYFNFQLKINLSILTLSFLSCICNCYNIHGLDPAEIIYHFYYYITILLYFSFTITFLTEVVKLLRR